MRVLPEDRGVQLPQLNSEIVWTGETFKTTVYLHTVWELMALVLGPLQNLLDKSSIDSRRMATLGPSAVSRSGVDALIALLGGKGLGTWTWHGVVLFRPAQWQWLFAKTVFSGKAEELKTLRHISKNNLL